MAGKIRTIESFAMVWYQPGQVFYTHKSDRDITAIANYHQRKMKTERMFAMDACHTRIETITKVTML